MGATNRPEVLLLLHQLLLMHFMHRHNLCCMSPCMSPSAEEYDSKHGARYVDNDAAAADMDEEWCKVLQTLPF